LAAELESAFGGPVELIAGSGGVFEVRSEEEVVFSKRALGRFPEPGEVVARLRRD